MEESKNKERPAGQSEAEFGEESNATALVAAENLDYKKSQSLDFILDVPLRVSVELGRTELTIKDLLQLGTGSVLELEKLAGEPLEILVNRRLVSRGEVVVINEKYGIRLTDIIDPIHGPEKESYSI